MAVFCAPPGRRANGAASRRSSGLRREREVLPVQPFDLSLGLFERAVVVDHVVGDGKAVFAGRLRRDHASRLLLAFGVTPPQALDLRRFAGIDDEDAVHAVLERRFDEQRDDDELVGPAGGPGSFLGDLADARVQDAFERLAPVVVPENHIAQLAAVEAPVRADDAGAELARDLLEGRLPGLDELPCDHVGIDHRHASLGEALGDHGFAARDAAGEADPENSHQPAKSRYQSTIRSPQTRATQPAAARQGPNGMGRWRSWRRNAISATPTSAPTSADSRMINGSFCQPSHAPSAARSLKSP